MAIIAHYLALLYIYSQTCIKRSPLGCKKVAL